ncbi:MAG: ABC transporter substrate-binding protein [Phycisphaeraceae bacterium]|nr:ABC transporter substrate-binding protein [Phycisphaeraceae bacterium]
MSMAPMVITRRAAIAALAGSGLAFAAFGPRGAKESVAGRTVIDYWEHWTGHEGAAMRTVVDRFNVSQDRIFVRYFSMNLIDQKAMVAIAGGDPPDVIGLWNFNIPAYSESNAIMPLDDLADRFGVRRENYAPAIWPLLTHAGRLWGVVNTCGSVALYYNRSLFREAGLDPDRPPRTIAELDAFAARLTREGKGRIDRLGFLHTEPNWWRWHWGYFFGGSIYDPITGQATAASADNTRAFEWMQQLPLTYGADAIAQFESGLGNYFTPQHAFLTGKVAMTNQGPWLANVINRFKPDLDYAVAPFPVEERLYDPSRPIGLLDCDILVVPAGARNPEASFEFIAFTQQQDQVEFLSTVHCKNSPLASASDRFIREHPNRYVRVHDSIAQSDRAFHFPRTRAWPLYRSEFDAAQQRMWTLQSEPADELLLLQGRVQSELDRLADRRRARAGQRHARFTGHPGGPAREFGA